MKIFLHSSQIPRWKNHNVCHFRKLCSNSFSDRR